MVDINRIFLFGDSWVEGQGIYNVFEGGVYREESFGGDLVKLSEWRKRNSWEKFIRKYTSAHIINEAVQGSDNYYQFRLLNKSVQILTPNDLVLFGFTSKLRDKKAVSYSFDLDWDNHLIDKGNPLRGSLGWERINLQSSNFGLNPSNEEYIVFKDNKEKEFTSEFIKDYFSTIYDDYPFEYISQVNYLFYQQRFKSLGLNIVFFDLFEPYLSPTFCKEGYPIDTDTYITFGRGSMKDWLVDYEKRCVSDNQVSVWERGYRRPDLDSTIYHPNQHGYEAWIDWMFNRYLLKRFKFKSI